MLNGNLPTNGMSASQLKQLNQLQVEIFSSKFKKMYVELASMHSVLQCVVAETIASDKKDLDRLVCDGVTGIISSSGLPCDPDSANILYLQPTQERPRNDQGH